MKAVSLTGIIILRPCYDTTGALSDFAIEYLNPAGQRMTGLAKRRPVSVAVLQGVAEQVIHYRAQVFGGERQLGRPRQRHGYLRPGSFEERGQV